MYVDLMTLMRQTTQIVPAGTKGMTMGHVSTKQMICSAEAAEQSNVSLQSHLNLGANLGKGQAKRVKSRRDLYCVRGWPRSLQIMESK